MSLYRLRRLAALAAAAVLSATALVLAPASPAQAAPPITCVNRAVCGYVDIGWSTRQGYEYIYERSAGTCVRVSLPNAWSGLWNNSGRTIRLFKNNYCGGSEHLTYYNGTGENQLSWSQHPTWDNNIESVQFR
jgi:hypothetical protein